MNKSNNKNYFFKIIFINKSRMYKDYFKEIFFL